MTAGAVDSGHAGAVLDSGVRDLVEIAATTASRCTRAASARVHARPRQTVAAQVPVRVGGVIVHPGDLIVGDVDGVVVVPHAQAGEVLKMAQEIDACELEQAKLIIAEKSLRKGLAKYGRI